MSESTPQLDDDTTFKILSRLPPVAAASAALVCKSWYTIIQNIRATVTVLRGVSPKNIPSSPYAVLSMLRNYPNLQTLTVRTLTASNLVAVEIMTRYASENIRVVDLTGVDYVDADLKELAKNCPNVTTWIDNRSEQVADKTVVEALKGWLWSLSSVSLAGAKSVTNATLIALFNHNIQNIDLSRCRLISKTVQLTTPRDPIPSGIEGATLSNPLMDNRKLSLVACNNLKSFILHDTYASVVDLQLSQCKALRRVEIHSPSLKILKLNGVPTLLHLQTSTPALETLNLYGCRGLNADDIHAILNGSKRFTNIILVGIPGISAVELYVDSLQFIDMSGCQAMTKVHVQSSSLIAIEMDKKTAANLTDLYVRAPKKVSFPAARNTWQKLIAKETNSVSWRYTG